MTETPPLHPIELEQLQGEQTLVATVIAPDDFQEDVRGSIGRLDRGDHNDSTPTLAFGSYDGLMETLTPRTLELIEAIRRDAPGSINESARVVDRDVKNVHEELAELARLGIIYFEEEGRSKRPIVWFDELVIELPFESDGDGSAVATS